MNANVTIDTGVSSEVRTIQYDNIDDKTISMMRKDGLNFTPGGTLLAKYEGDTLIGLVGFKVQGKDYGLLIDYNVGWVHPYWRSKGIYQDMFKMRDDMVLSMYGDTKIKYRTLASEKSYGVFIANGFNLEEIDCHEEDMSIERAAVPLVKLTRYSI